MLADYDFYRNTYKGIVFADATSYEYFGERASDELALFSDRAVFAENPTANNQLKRCACRIADILYSSNNGKVGSKTISSESVAGYYSVSYATTTDEQIKAQINSTIKLYIGRYILGAVRVMW